MTEALAAFLAQARWAQVPEPIRREGKRALLNVAGCIVAGREDEAVRILRRAYPGEDALIDAAAATAHDYDDTHLRTVIHASPPVAGAVFSLSRQKKLSGAELLHAFILGLETTCRLGNAVMPGHYEHGWHITSTCGVFGATAAAGKLLGLSRAQFVHAFGLAATQAAGLVEMLGSMARVLNAGFAARNGIVAARLAAEGFEGPAQPIEGLRGFFNVFGGKGERAALPADLGGHWAMRNVVYKPYPSGVVLHALIDAVLAHREALQKAEAITVELHPLAIERTHRPQPRNALEARLSAQHAVAVATMRGRAGLAEFSDEAALDPAIAAFRNRVRVVPQPALDKMAAVLLAGAKKIEAPAPRPLDDARLEAKFGELAGAQAGAWRRVIDALEGSEAVSMP